MIVCLRVCLACGLCFGAVWCIAWCSFGFGALDFLTFYVLGGWCDIAFWLVFSGLADVVWCGCVALIVFCGSCFLGLVCVCFCVRRCLGFGCLRRVVIVDVYLVDF